MRIIYAISGEEIAEVEDPLDNARDAKVAASEALGVHPALLRVRVTQCSVLVISGKILCRRYRCAARVTCSCRAPEDVCRCEVVQSDVTEAPPALQCLRGTGPTSRGCRRDVAEPEK